MRPMRPWMLGLVVMGAAACAHEEPARAPQGATGTGAPTETTAADPPLGPGISGSTQHGLNQGPDGTPYQGNVDPSNPASNRNKRPEPNDVRTSPNAK